MIEKDFDSPYISKYGTVVGIDEVGRGALAGPVVAAAVLLKKPIEGVDDSKKINREKRELLFKKLILSAQIAFGIATPTEVDIYNVIGATKLAMERAYRTLGMESFVLVDGLEVGLNFFHKCIVKGDGKSPSIAAASIAAKVFRDDIMKKVSNYFADYGFEHNMGYGTPQHIRALKENGPTVFHRLTYAPVRNALNERTLKDWIASKKISPKRIKAEMLHLFFN